jgi:hypothetical protein
MKEKLPESHAVEEAGEVPEAEPVLALPILVLGLCLASAWAQGASLLVLAFVTIPVTRAHFQRVSQRSLHH